VLTGMRIATLRLVGEVERGVPLSLAGGLSPFPVITKAGAFGDAQTLLRCRHALRAWGSVEASAERQLKAQA
jgi:D-threonate/D-erythronate kinase